MWINKLSHGRCQAESKIWLIPILIYFFITHIDMVSGAKSNKLIINKNSILVIFPLKWILFHSNTVDLVVDEYIAGVYILDTGPL